jgi:hypothetical protein
MTSVPLILVKALNGVFMSAEMVVSRKFTPKNNTRTQRTNILTPIVEHMYRPHFQ